MAKRTLLIAASLLILLGIGIVFVTVRNRSEQSSQSSNTFMTEVGEKGNLANMETDKYIFYYPASYVRYEGLGQELAYKSSDNKQGGANNIGLTTTPRKPGEKFSVPTEDECKNLAKNITKNQGFSFENFKIIDRTPTFGCQFKGVADSNIVMEAVNIVNENS